jgi:glycylpeptide N-tetradecanoyltransferase
MSQNRFWSSQPVPLDGIELPDGKIQAVNPQEISTKSSTLPIAYSWSDLDLKDSKAVEDLCTFLNDNYLEDRSGNFGTLYNSDFIKWALLTPDFKRSYQIQVLNRLKLVGFISGTLIKIKIDGEIKNGILINFLCIHKNLRGKRLSPVLIRELSRRIRLDGFDLAIFSSGTKLSKPITTARCFHRDLNPKKLVITGFTPLSPREKLSTYIKSQDLTESKFKFRPLRLSDVDSVAEKLNKFLEKYRVSQYFTPALISWQFLDRFCYVYEVDGRITDMISFYYVDSSIKNSNRYEKLTEANLFYYFTENLTRSQLIEEACILAKKYGADVFTAPALISEKELLDLKFKPGNGILHYYLGNWSISIAKEEFHFFLY